MVVVVVERCLVLDVFLGLWSSNEGLGTFSVSAFLRLVATFVWVSLVFVTVFCVGALVAVLGADAFGSNGCNGCRPALFCASLSFDFSFLIISPHISCCWHPRHCGFINISKIRGRDYRSHCRNQT